MKAMERYLSGSREHEGHRYDPADFGLDEDAVRRAFETGQPLRAEAPVPAYS